MLRNFFPLLLVGAFCFASCNQNDSTASGTQQFLGPEKFDTTLDGRKVSLVMLENSKGMKAAVTNYGARMVGLWVPVADSLVDVVLGFDNIHDYVMAEERFFGAIVGRFGNRIAKGKFSLDGKSYQLGINNTPNTLHGGVKGFHSVVWEIVESTASSVELKYVSPDGDEGYPGELTVFVKYSLNDENELSFDYKLKSDQKTIANVTNHNYWNLNGEGSGTINNHLLQVAAKQYTPVDETLIPTGIEPVAGTPFDFTSPKPIGRDLDTVNEQLKYGLGYDHNFVLDKGVTAKTELVAIVEGDKTGIEMKIYSDCPGLQFYGGNFMKSQHVLKSGARDDFRTAFCLETQYFPDSPNQPSFPSVIIEPGKEYTSRTVHVFSVKSK